MMNYKQTLESMVTHLVQCTCDSAIDCPKGKEKELVRPKERALGQPISNLCCKQTKGKVSMTWNSILTDLLSRCPQFCRDEVVNPPKPLVPPRWRDRNDRKVLAPLALKQNTDNIIAGNLDMSRKRKADSTNNWIPNKLVKINNEQMKPCSVVMRRTPLKILLLQYKCVSNKSYVKLHDILKEIPQEKEVVKPVTQNDYMKCLGLDTREPVDQKQRPEVRTSHPIRLVSHPQIPFSSDYGRRLLARERHCLPQEVVLRKIERTEWYLKGAAVVSKNNSKPEIFYDRRAKYMHTYKPPKRQFSQKHQSLEQSFVRYVCKPVCVELQNDNLDTLMAKINKSQGEEEEEKKELTPSISEVNESMDEKKIIADTNLCNVNNIEVLTLNCAISSNNGIGDVESGSNEGEIVSTLKLAKKRGRPFKRRRRLTNTSNIN